MNIKKGMLEEINSQLDMAAGEVNHLKAKINELERQIHESKMIKLNQQDLQEEISRLHYELDQQKQKNELIIQEYMNRKMKAGEFEEKLRESDILINQLKKKISYFELMTQDAERIAETHEKLQSQQKKSANWKVVYK
ncbi:MAG: hypothetical protein N2747_05120 [Chitinophagaceae bacterium]|nr:hypothetical protein [Chitinophagaceae bacterium]